MRIVWSRSWKLYCRLSTTCTFFQKQQFASAPLRIIRKGCLPLHYFFRFLKIIWSRWPTLKDHIKRKPVFVLQINKFLLWSHTRNKTLIRQLKLPLWSSDSSHTYWLPHFSSLRSIDCCEIIAILNVYRSVICTLCHLFLWDFVFKKTFLFSLTLSSVLINTTDKATGPIHRFEVRTLWFGFQVTTVL